MSIRTICIPDLKHGLLKFLFVLKGVEIGHLDVRVVLTTATVETDVCQLVGIGQIVLSHEPTKDSVPAQDNPDDSAKRQSSVLTSGKFCGPNIGWCSGMHG